MRVQDVMTSPVAVVPPSGTLRDAAALMKDQDIGILPVCDGEDIKGMITDRDIVVRAIADGMDVETSKVSDVMSPDFVYVYQDQDVTEAAHVMEARKIRRLLVLGRDRKLVGVASIGDIALHADNVRLTGEVLQHVARPTAEVGKNP